jgi:hypothetical protein
MEELQLFHMADGVALNYNSKYRNNSDRLCGLVARVPGYRS